VSHAFMTMPSGILLVNKPTGVTSHDVVQLVRRKLSLQRIGHSGTLDPMAQGLLVVLVGAATSYQQQFQAHEKTYEAVMRLGTQTDTGDAMGTTVRTAPVPLMDRGRLQEVLATLQGPWWQTPPAYSAVKVRGRPAYWWTRRHQPVTLTKRLAHLFEITLLDCTPETITFRVHCSAGTYIRVLAEVIAEQLGTVGHLAHLMRLRVGQWTVDEAQPLAWIAQASPEDVTSHLRPVMSFVARPQPC